MESARAMLLKMSQVEKLTGVGAHTLRAWERRYGVPRPQRSNGRQRLYSAAEVAIVRRMQELAAEGMALAHAAEIATRDVGTRWEGLAHGGQPILERFLEALLNFDERSADAAVAEALGAADIQRLFESLMVPALVRIGDGWHEGRVGIGQEHFATSYMRGRIEALGRQTTPSPHSPAVLLACIGGQRHELGLLMVAVLLRFRGLRTVFLGQDVPEDAVLRTVEDVQPAVVALSVDSGQVPQLESLSRGLRQMAPYCRVVYGGRGVTEAAMSEGGPVYGGPTLGQAVETISRIARQAEGDRK
jgi:MerR family transcriptional regulator, light-induced transcriptional regulator